jgi:hypothetical protein
MELELLHNTLSKDRISNPRKDHNMVFLTTTHECLLNYKQKNTKNWETILYYVLLNKYSYHDLHGIASTLILKSCQGHSHMLFIKPWLFQSCHSTSLNPIISSPKPSQGRGLSIHFNDIIIILWVITLGYNSYHWEVVR